MHVLHNVWNIHFTVAFAECVDNLNLARYPRLPAMSHNSCPEVVSCLPFYFLPFIGGIPRIVMSFMGDAGRFRVNFFSYYGAPVLRSCYNRYRSARHRRTPPIRVGLSSGPKFPQANRPKFTYQDRIFFHVPLVCSDEQFHPSRSEPALASQYPNG